MISLLYKFYTWGQMLLKYHLCSISSNPSKINKNSMEGLLALIGLALLLSEPEILSPVVN